MEFDWVLASRWPARSQRGRSALNAMPAAARVVGVVPHERVVTRLLRLPPGRRARSNVALAAAMEPHLLSAAEANAVIALADTPSGETVLAAVSRLWIGAWVAAFAQAGRALDALIPEFSLARPAAHTWLVVYSALTGGYLQSDRGDVVALDAAPLDEAPLGLVLGLRKAIAAGAAPKRIELQLLPGSPPVVLDAWQRAVGIPLDGPHRLDWAARVAARMTGPRHALPNLLASARQKGSQPAWLTGWRGAVIVALMIPAFHVAASAVYWISQSHQRAAVQGEVRALANAALGGREPVIEPVLQVRRELDRLRRAAGQYTDTDLVAILGSIAPHLAGLPEAAVRAVVFRSGVLALDVDARSRVRLEAALAPLERAGYEAGIRASSDPAILTLLVTVRP